MPAVAELLSWSQFVIYKEVVCATAHLNSRRSAWWIRWFRFQVSYHVLHVTYDVYILQAAVEEYSVHTILNCILQIVGTLPVHIWCTYVDIAVLQLTGLPWAAATLCITTMETELSRYSKFPHRKSCISVGGWSYCCSWSHCTGLSKD